MRKLSPTIGKILSHIDIWFDHILEYADLNDGYDADAGDGRHYPVGSLIVRPGCTFYQFHESHYNGGWNVYEGKPLYKLIFGNFL